LSDPLKFTSDLSDWFSKNGFNKEKDELLNRIKAKTGASFKKDFNKLLANEFAVVTTRYFEKFAIIGIKDGSKIKSLLGTISTMNDENSGQINYDKLPYFLLGNPFNIFKRPYFIVIDNYLILANSMNELKSYNEIYLNRKFLNKSDQFNQFENLLAERSNISYSVNLKNIQPILDRDMNTDISEDIKNNEPGLKDFYALSVQLTSADKNFYTNLCLKLNTDTTDKKNK
jgi:hypothetical protein